MREEWADSVDSEDSAARGQVPVGSLLPVCRQRPASSNPGQPQLARKGRRPRRLKPIRSGFPSVRSFPSHHQRVRLPQPERQALVQAHRRLGRLGLRQVLLRELVRRPRRPHLAECSIPR